PATAAPLSPRQMSESAFHPPITALRIIHSHIPFWPVDIVTEASNPMSVGDVLVTLHRAMHQRISSADWNTLSAVEADAVTKAFNKRCHTEAIWSIVVPAQWRDRTIMERNDGVKRVDFLMGRTIFQGIVKAPQDPDGCLRMVTA
ncbi:hypothetical protein B0H13DRAFT_1589479, partial [Mycena leptocephala]